MNTEGLELPPQFEDDEDAESRSIVRPLATRFNQPIPALREVRAQIASLGEDGTAKASSDGSVENVVVLHDPENLAPKPVVLSTMAYALSTLFNGERNADDVAVLFREKYSQPIQPEQVLELQRELDKALFLYSRNFEKTLRKQIHGYLEAKARPAFHAGNDYPAEPDELRKTIDGFFTAPDGPDEGKTERTRPASASGTVRAIVAPHIDLRVGGATYAHAYKEILSNCDAEIFFILGVAHQNPANSLFCVSQKDFDTPFGVVRTDAEIAGRLHDASGGEPALCELAHRTEHSIEFQAVLLADLLKSAGREFKIVPVLCGSVETFLDEDSSPLDSDEFISFTDALRREIDACNRKWCVLCSVDFSHVGPEFGHSSMITERVLPPIRRGDMRLLRLAEKLDADGFYNEIGRTQNSRHVDAVLSLLAMLKACQGLLTTGRLLHYDQMLKKGTHSAVSYAAMAFE